MCYMPKEYVKEHSVSSHVAGGPVTRLKYVIEVCRSWKNLGSGDSLDKQRSKGVVVVSSSVCELET